jgi:hypothetical protein
VVSSRYQPCAPPEGDQAVELALSEFWLENRLMIEVVSPEMEQEYKDFLKNARTEVMGDPKAVRLMRATHVKEPA